MLRALALFTALVLADAVLPDWDDVAPPGRPTRLALHAGALYLGTESGLYRREPSNGRAWSLVLPAEPIFDLASDGAELFVATAAGLWSVAPGTRTAVRLPLGAGDDARSLAVDDSGTLWVATAAGLFRRARGASDFAREESVPAGAIDAVASAGGEVWIGVDASLWARAPGGAFERRMGGVELGWWQLRGAARSGDATLLGVASGVWRIDAAGARQVELGIDQVSRLARARDRVFVASERGLYDYAFAELGTGAGRQVLSVESLGLAADAAKLWVATERGLATFSLERGAAEPTRVARPRTFERRAHAERVARLQSAVLSYQELAPARLTAIESRARWKGLYPELRAGAGFDRDGEWNGGYDDSFTSGALHRLTDGSRSKSHGYDAAVTLVWELSDLVSPDDPLSVSRERRLVVSLRDQVLERVNHLYFQRLRALEQLAALGADDAKRAELELTAAELAAQLDAWSGGEFTRLEESSPLEAQREP